MDEFFRPSADEELVTEVSHLVDRDSKLNPSIYVKVISILFVRAGLFLSQVSSIPSSNIQILIFQNIIDIALNTVVYAIIGYSFSFGTDFNRIIGLNGLLTDDANRSEFAEGWLIVITVSGLLIAAIGDRISFFSSLIINTLISGLVLPVFIHWILSESGWMHMHKLGQVQVSYKDYSYSCLIHMCGGFLALISMLILNKRLLRFKDMDVSAIPDNGPSLTLFGNFFMIIGFLGIGIPTEKYIIIHPGYDVYGIVMINTLLSAFGAATIALLLTFSCPCEPLHKWTSMRSMQAGISGIAVIAGGADVYSPLASLIAGVCNGILFFFVSFLISLSPIEDYSNIIACHFVSGLLGSLLPPLLGIREGFGTNIYFSFIHFAWQLFCDLALLSIIIAIFSPIVLLLDRCSILRSWDEDVNHRRALFAGNKMKSQKNNYYEPQNQDRTISYAESEVESKTQTENVESESENVDVLFEKNTENEPTKNETQSISSNSLPKSNPKEIVYENRLEYDKEKYLINYILNSEPLAFFEEIKTDVREKETEMKLKNCGENNVKSIRFSDIKLIKGIRNISDSKILNKFKDNWPIPKKKMIRNREHSLRLGSATNVWVPSSIRISMETQV